MNREEKLKELFSLSTYKVYNEKVILVRTDFNSKDIEKAEKLVRELNNGKLSHGWNE